MFFTLPNQSFAQAPDTIIVSAMPPGNLNVVITGDTTASGQRNNPNRVYMLQQTGAFDSTYFITATVYSNFNLTIIGKINPTTGHPPVIAPFINADNSSPSTYFVPLGGNITFRNLYFSGQRVDQTSSTGSVALPSGDSITVVADHCVFDDFQLGNNSNVFMFAGTHYKVFITNSDFRNNQSDYFDQPSALWFLGSTTADTVVIANNTFSCNNKALMGAPGYIKYFRFEHNTVFFSTSRSLVLFQAVTAIIRNNIFYGAFFRGYTTTETTHEQWHPTKVELPALIMFDSLSTLANPPYNLKESDRNIVLQNNVYFWPKDAYNYWTSINDTASDKLVPPLWMNPQTALMFTDKTTWPGFSASNNDSTDPGFNSSLVQSTDNNIINYLNLNFTTGTASGSRWKLFPDDPTTMFASVSTNWAETQGYPIPENLKYSNAALLTAGTDGKPLGDLNWFSQLTGVAQVSNNIPEAFSLSQNYPNPFNPTTIIEYTVPKSSFVSLKVYNILGQEVATLYRGFQKAGSYKADFDASKLSSGVYLYNLQSNGFTLTKKMVLMK